MHNSKKSFRRKIRKSITGLLVLSFAFSGAVVYNGSDFTVNAEGQNETVDDNGSQKKDKEEIKKGWQFNEAKGGYSYYENGKAVTGFKKLGERTYLFDKNGIVQQGFVKVDKTLYYLGRFDIEKAEAGTAEKNETGFQKMSNQKDGRSAYFYIYEDLKVATGLQEVEGKVCLFDGDGAMQTGWQKSGDKWFYFGEKPENFGMHKSCWVDDYWIDADGTQTYPHKGAWGSDSWGWWYGDATGWYPVNQWLQIDSKWYYFDEWGYMVRAAWRNIGGVYYYFNFDGTLQEGARDSEGEETGQYIDGFWVDHSGAWTGATAYWYWDGTGYQLWDNNGWHATDTEYIIDQTRIQFDEAGYANYGGTYLTTVPPMGGAASAAKNNIIQYASRSLGFPYVYGGQTMAGTDCSGFTMLAYNYGGYYLPHNAGMQYTTLSSNEVWISEVQPGDLLFYMSGDVAHDYGTGIGHVALYIGNGQTLEAGDKRNGYRWHADKAAYVIK